MIIIFRRLMTLLAIVVISLVELTAVAQAYDSDHRGMRSQRPVIGALAGVRAASPKISSFERPDILNSDRTVSESTPLTLSQQHSANVRIEPLRPLALGDHPTIIVHLTTEFNNPIPNQPIVIFVDGVRKAQGRTDSHGIVSIPLRYRFDAGTYKIKAVYGGFLVLGLGATSDQVELLVEPANAVLRTVPPIPGINFKLNDEIYTSDENGIVSLDLVRSGLYRLEVLPINDDALSPNTQVEFSRWNDKVFVPNRQIYLPRPHALEAGFVLSYQVDQIFFDSKGDIVDPGRVSSMTLRGVGKTYTFTKAGPIWLPANRLSRRVGERLESQDILYYFRSIIIDGANVINQSQQRFHVQPDDVWSLNLLLYSSRF